jgi:hypothetical protein
MLARLSRELIYYLGRFITVVERMNKWKDMFSKFGNINDMSTLALWVGLLLAALPKPVAVFQSSFLQ